MRTTDTHVYFWKGYLSNWNLTDFWWEADGEMPFKFNCGEQYMMFRKAVMFGDTETAIKIMQTNIPKEQKDLGRQVKNYDDAKWSAQRFDIMVDGLYERFSQNTDIREKLLATGDKILVEASPYDNIWGVGLEETDDAILDEKNWQGQNLLGKVLMEVRSVLKEHSL